MPTTVSGHKIHLLTPMSSDCISIDTSAGFMSLVPDFSERASVELPSYHIPKLMREYPRVVANPHALDLLYSHPLASIQTGDLPDYRRRYLPDQKPPP